MEVYREDAHARPRHRLAECFCIGRVVLTALEAGLDTARRHQPDLVVKPVNSRTQLCAVARLDTDQARSEAG